MVSLLRKSTGNKPRREGSGAAAGKDIGVGVSTPIGHVAAGHSSLVQTALLTWKWSWDRNTDWILREKFWLLPHGYLYSEGGTMFIHHLPCVLHTDL